MNPSAVRSTWTPNPRNPHPAPRPTRRVRRVCENDDYAAFTRRILAAHGRRIARGDIAGLADLAALGNQVDTAIRHAITGLRVNGYSWADIADQLGTTRQAAHQRYHTTDQPEGTDR